MEYCLVISENEFSKTLIKESERLLKEVYGKNIHGIYYRARKEQRPSNPRKLFIKGRGIAERIFRPHITIAPHLEIPKNLLSEFIKNIENITKKQKPFILIPKGIGDYDQDFTFFLEFEKNKEIISFHHKILQFTKRHMSKERYNKLKKASYIPHVTILYDDLDPKKLKLAQKKAKLSNLLMPIKVNSILLWLETLHEQKIIKEFSLGVGEGDL